MNFGFNTLNIKSLILLFHYVELLQKKSEILEKISFFFFIFTSIYSFLFSLKLKVTKIEK
jgi:hypothetical protein